MLNIKPNTMIKLMANAATNVEPKHTAPIIAVSDESTPQHCVMAN